MEEALRNFESVWQRVSGVAASTELPEPEVLCAKPGLESLMDDLSSDLRFCRDLCRRFPGQIRGVLTALAAQKQQQLRRFQTEYYLETGRVYAPKSAERGETERVLPALRIICLGEQRAAERFETLAETGTPTVRELCVRCAESCRGNAALLRRLISRLI